MVLTKYIQKILLAIGRRFRISSLQADTSSLRGVRKHDVAIHSLKWFAMTLLLLAMTLSPVQAAWFNGDWSSREKITIKASQVNSDLNEFPVYLNLADLPDSFFTSVNGTGADIRMTLADEITETSFELVEIDTVNGTGELWFKAPFLSSTTGTDFYIYYGNPGATAYTDSDPYGTHNVWSNGFVAVYHMNENPTGAIIDSTSFGNNGTSAGAMNSSDLISGKVGKALDLDGVNDLITINDDNSLDFGTNDFAASLWLNINSSTLINNTEYGLINKNSNYEGTPG